MRLLVGPRRVGGMRAGVVIVQKYLSSVWDVPAAGLGARLTQFILTTGEVGPVVMPAFQMRIMRHPKLETHLKGP